VQADAVKNLQVGDEVPPLVKPIAQRQIDVYSGVRPRSIHSDEDWARQKGFKTTLAQGMMSSAYVSQMMMRLLGGGYVRGGKMSIAFIKPVHQGDTLTLRGVVKEKIPENGRTRIVLDVWCENQDGVKTMAGTASGLY